MRQCVLALFLLLSPAILPAATIHVPADQPTIQTGIDAASAGDTVLVACGTYYEHDIQMISGLTLLSETGSQDCVTIDGESASRILSCSSLTNVKIQGITFRNGGGESTGSGGAVLIENSTVEVYYCAFIANASSQKGGALLVNGALVSGVDIADCIFNDNYSGDVGGGIAIDAVPSGEVSILRCEFNGNMAYNDGGGAWVSETGSATFQDCVFEQNRADFVDIFQSHGGGISSDGEVYVFGCQFLYNSSFLGGAIHSYKPSSPPDAILEIDHCLFVGNTAIGTTTGGGGAIRLHRSSCTITSSTFVSNSSSVFGSSIEATYYSTCTIAASIFTGGDSFPIRCNENSTFDCSCTNIFGNVGGDWVNCITDQLDINGNISLDPLFCDPDMDDYHLRSDSPCAPDNNDCGVLMGAWPVGCSTSTENATWSEVKALF